jgi:hypothetical protein
VPAYLLCDDLLFTSRIIATARASGLDIHTARTPAQLQNLITQQVPSCVLLDLHCLGLSVPDLVQTLPSPRPFVVGYGSHVDAARLKAARDAGCDLVLPRSKFVEGLAEALPRWCAPR